MKKCLLVALLALTAGIEPSSASSIIYSLDDTVGAVTVTGTITTDGFIGTFPDSFCCRPPDILDWNLVISSGTHSQSLVPDDSFIGGLSGGPITPGALSDLVATKKELIWNYDPAGLFNIQTNSSNGGTIGFSSNGFFLEVSGQGFNIGATEVLTLGQQFVFAEVDHDSHATPLPAALPLFATGLAGIGVLGWRRKRKGAAAIAAA
jgi:hypothetical protein